MRMHTLDGSARNRGGGHANVGMGDTDEGMFGVDRAGAISSQAGWSDGEKGKGDFSSVGLVSSWVWQTDGSPVSFCEA